MRIACRIRKATETHSEYVSLIVFFTTALVARMRLNIMYVRTLPVLFLAAIDWSVSTV